MSDPRINVVWCWERNRGEEQTLRLSHAGCRGRRTASRPSPGSPGPRGHDLGRGAQDRGRSAVALPLPRGRRFTGGRGREPRFTVTPEGPCPGDESEGGRSLRSRPVLDPGLSLTVPWGRVVGRPLGAVAAEHHAPCAQGRLGWQMVFRVFCHRKMNLKSDTEIQKVRKVVGRRTKIACENPAP